MPNSNLNKNNHQYDYFRYLRTTPASISILRCMFGMFFFRSSPNRFIISYQNTKSKYKNISRRGLENEVLNLSSACGPPPVSVMYFTYYS